MYNVQCILYFNSVHFEKLCVYVTTCTLFENSLLQRLLPNLEKLDLSYNVIEKIENLAVSQLNLLL